MPPSSGFEGRVFVGIGGWVYEPWRGSFYPPGLAQARELEHASRQLGSIEINGTFYGSQKPESFRKWHDATPEGFVFALKGPRFATNRRVLAEAGESIGRFFASGVVELREKLGPVNWQFAATKKFDAADFAAFLRLLPKQLEGRAIRHALEVRHESFRDPAFTALAREHGAAIVLAGDSAYPEIDEATADFAYVRIMGTAEGEATGYSPEALDAWAKRARLLASGGRDLFLYVISGHKVINPAAAMALIERLERLAARSLGN